MTENQSTFIEGAVKVTDAIPLTEILVGIVVPIMATWISYMELCEVSGASGEKLAGFVAGCVEER